MRKMLAYCGLTCDSCPIHLATLEQDQLRQQTMREAIAEQLSIHYGMNLPPLDITDCDGCRVSFGRLFSGCLECEVRKCAGRRKMENCAYCPEYPCKQLRKFFSGAPEAQTRLEEIRKENKII